MTRTRRDERGAASAFVLGMAITLLVVAGLVVDGGGALNARMTLADDVEAAAVAGAQATDELRLRADDVLVIDPAEARERAAAVLAGRGYEGIRIVVTDESVTVTARDRVPTLMLNLIGINEFDIEATATSEAEILQ
ncbi:pilus assembly protein TadE [Nocardioides silvaticus]|uniref:Pilus assembly protein TadE n=1 Tax=Nocardioides silvaticus TaxID=2201891 RepID=A0A316TNG0_9ACTN|nr:pilus assembly protein TadE [Nocardioides silvaticus]PWN04575.1 pilus assembly protein TadE [Nocardioides silvaticus]